MSSFSLTVQRKLNRNLKNGQFFRDNLVVPAVIRSQNRMELPDNGGQRGSGTVTVTERTSALVV